MARVSWTLGAERDLQEIVDVIAATSRIYAASVYGQVLSSVDRLHDYPRIGRVVPEYDHENIRELVVGSYRVIYVHELVPDTVSIAAILHGSRDVSSAFDPRRP